MIVRVGLLVAASVAALAVRQLNEKNAGSPNSRNRRSGILSYEFLMYQYSFSLLNDANKVLRVGLSLLFI